MGGLGLGNIGVLRELQVVGRVGVLWGWGWQEGLGSLKWSLGGL